MHPCPALHAVLDLLNCSRCASWRRLAKPAVEQADHNVGLVDELLVDDRLRIAPELRHSVELPAQREQHDLLCTRSIPVPALDGCLNDVASVACVARRGDEDSQDSGLEAHCRSCLWRMEQIGCWILRSRGDQTMRQWARAAPSRVFALGDNGSDLRRHQETTNR